MELDTIQLADAYAAIKKIPDKSIDLIYTDIPYLVENHGGGGATVLKTKNITPNMETLRTV